MRLLIVGGAGYIGSHVVLAALSRGFSVTVFDDLSSGSEQNINENISFIKGSTFFKSELINLFKNNKFDVVIHLAGRKAAGDSMVNPLEYAENNIIGSFNLMNACLKYDVKKFIFSSSAAVYGEPKYVPIDELHTLYPNNYYGYTKLTIENNLKWFSELKGIRYGILRYFNAAGYDLEGRVSGLEVNSQNLIPKVMETAIGERKQVNIFGDNYNTKDGTAIRDYVHVSDLARAHIDVIQYIDKENKDVILNLGSGNGYSVLEVVNKIINISGKKIKYEYQNRRLGDSDTLIAKADLAKNLFGWECKYSDLDTIIDSTWNMYKTKNKW